MVKLPGILLACLILLPSVGRAEAEPISDSPVIPETIRDDVRPLGFGMGLGSLAFSFGGVGVHVTHSLATAGVADTLSIAGPDVLLTRTSRTHRLVAVMSVVRVAPLAASLIGLGTARDDLDLLRSLGLPYVVLGIYDLLAAGISGTSAIRLYNDRRASTSGWTSAADDVADASIEAGGAWAGGMLAIGTIELIVGGLALHGSIRTEALRTLDARLGLQVRLLPAPGGAVLVGRF